MEKCDLKPGDIVQINPDHDEVFGGCLMIVMEPKAFGAQGFVQIPGKGQAYYRCAFENMEPTGGRAEWVIE
jgi:hypothetical protein